MITIVVECMELQKAWVQEFGSGDMWILLFRAVEIYGYLWFLNCWKSIRWSSASDFLSASLFDKSFVRLHRAKDLHLYIPSSPTPTP